MQIVETFEAASIKGLGEEKNIYITKSTPWPACPQPPCSARPVSRFFSFLHLVPSWSGSGNHAGRACRLPLAWIQSRSCLRFSIRSSFRPLCSFRPFSSLQFASCSCAPSFYHAKTIHTTKTFIQVWTGEPVASNRSPIFTNM